MNKNDQEIRKRPKAQVYGRMLCSWVDPEDFNQMIMRADVKGEDWVKVCEEIGDRDFNYAQKELENGHIITARHFFISAEAAYRVGQYGLTDITDEKMRLYHKLTDSYACAAKLYDPALEEVNIPYNGYNMHGWLMMPKNAPKKCPVVLMIAGATGFKEEVINQAQNMLDRGIAVLNMDGPGQGVTMFYNHGYLEVDNEKAHSVMIDWLEQDGRFGKIAIYGNSTGGYYVARTAVTDSRLAACVVFGGSYQVGEITRFEKIYLHKFAVLYNTTDEIVEKELFPKMTLEGIAQNITCPLLIVHGENDTLFSVEGVQRLYNEASSEDKTIIVYPNTWHCAAGNSIMAMHKMADWLASRLK